MFFKPKRIYKLHYKVFAEYETVIMASSPAKAITILEKRLKKRYGSGCYQIISVSEYIN